MRTVAFVLVVGVLITQVTVIRCVRCNSPNDQIAKWHFRYVFFHPKLLPHLQVISILFLAPLLYFVDVMMTVHGREY